MAELPGALNLVQVDLADPVRAIPGGNILTGCLIEDMRKGHPVLLCDVTRIAYLSPEQRAEVRETANTSRILDIFRGPGGAVYIVTDSKPEPHCYRVDLRPKTDAPTEKRAGFMQKLRSLFSR